MRCRGRAGLVMKPEIEAVRNIISAGAIKRRPGVYIVAIIYQSSSPIIGNLRLPTDTNYFIPVDSGSSKYRRARTASTRILVLITKNKTKYGVWMLGCQG